MINLGPAFRATPAMPVQAYKTYRVASPVGTHWREATCAEVDCERWRDGWDTIVDEGTGLGMQQAAYIRAECVSVLAVVQPGDPRRRYSESRGEDGRTVFSFPPGQQCFAGEPHRVRLARPELYLVRGGDWRANTGLIRRHTGPADWVEDFAENQDRITTVINRG
jgi:hypothetical protein